MMTSRIKIHSTSTAETAVPVQPPPPPNPNSLREMNTYGLLEWKPKWSQHKFVVMGPSDKVEHTAVTYDKGVNEGEISRRVKEGDFDLLIDIGSAFGYYPCLLKSVRPDIPVVAIEADPTRYGCLLRNTAFYDDMEVIYGMAGAYDLRINVIQRMCDVRVQNGTEIRNRRTIKELWELRSLAVRPLIKIDVEGGEDKILAGSREVMSDARTRWIVECHQWCATPIDEIADWFRDCGRSPVVGMGGQISHVYVD